MKQYFIACIIGSLIMLFNSTALANTVWCACKDTPGGFGYACSENYEETQKKCIDNSHTIPDAEDEAPQTVGEYCNTFCGYGDSCYAECR